MLLLTFDSGPSVLMCMFTSSNMSSQMKKEGTMSRRKRTLTRDLMGRTNSDFEGDRATSLQGMHVLRARAALPLRSTAEALCKSKWHQHGGERLHILRMLTTTRGADFMESGAGLTTSHMQKQIVDALRLGERRKASNLLLDFSYRRQSLTADDFVDIINYCARTPDPLFVMEIWKLLEASNISLNNMCLFLIMQALCKGGYLEEAFNMMNFVRESQHLYPVLSLYNSFLRACADMQNITHASKCLDLMEKQMVGRNEDTYTELLKLAVLQNNLSVVHQIWEEYIKQYSMSIIALRKFIWSFTRLGDLTSAFNALQQMVSFANSGHIFIDSKVDGKLYSTRLDIPVPSNRRPSSTILDMKENQQVNSSTCPPSVYLLDATSASLEQQIIFMGYEEAKSAEMSRLNGQKHTTPFFKVLRSSFSDVIHACAQGQNYGIAEQLFLQMQNLGLQPSSHTYDGFVRAVVSERGFSDGLEVVSSDSLLVALLASGKLKVMRQKNLKPYNSTLATLSICCSEAQELDIAEALLNQISEYPHPHPYNALLASCDKMNQPERAVRVLAKMKQMNMLPDIRTYELLFSLFTNVNAPYEEGNMISQVDAAKRISAIESDMAKNGIPHSSLSMKSLLKALGEEGMITKMIQYLHVAENLFIHREPSLGTAMYNLVLHSLVEAKESHRAIEIFKKMKFCGFKSDAATYNIMIDCCSILRCFKSASLLVSIMIREGFYPDTPTYTALIKILLGNENFNEALNLLNRVRLDGKQLDVLLFNTILQKACDKRRIDVIEFIVECMHQEKVQPDPSTCSYVFSAYVNSGFLNTAIEALQVLSLRMMGVDGDMYEEKKEFVDEFILAEDSGAESRILAFFKESEENLAIALLNLRWCAMAGFPMCCGWFFKGSREHRIVSLQVLSNRQLAAYKFLTSCGGSVLGSTNEGISYFMSPVANIVPVALRAFQCYDQNLTIDGIKSCMITRLGI
ncbi:pentatricopeptide repeat-containing protein [Senna tora]|uniref:Pentatricopeptide repeat-containing protein n=1 Tax=Senna tora TaxID=362788 RepID=A0A834WE78_9FABA|nr:pentatricopeptide repeat-containing protein [Senna tora]